MKKEKMKVYLIEIIAQKKNKIYMTPTWAVPGLLILIVAFFSKLWYFSDANFKLVSFIFLKQ